MYIPDKQLNVLLQIVKEVSKGETTYKDATGERICVFCYGHEDKEDPLNYYHEDSCITMKANEALFASIDWSRWAEFLRSRGINPASPNAQSLGLRMQWGKDYAHWLKQQQKPSHLDFEVK